MTDVSFMECNLDFVLTLHGLVRWLVLAMGALGLGLVLFRRPWRIGQVTGPAFVALLDVQLLLGVLIFILDPESRRESILHVSAMGVAVILAHVLRKRAKHRPTSGLRLAAAVYLVPFALILVGLWTLE